MYSKVIYTASALLVLTIFLYWHRTIIPNIPPVAVTPLSTTPSNNQSSPIQINSIYRDKKIIFHGPSDKKLIALTFDADMTPKMLSRLQTGEVKSWYNQDVIDTLISTQTPATLFLTGLWIETYPEVTQELANNPLFELGNHSYDHPAFSHPCYKLKIIDNLQKTKEIEKTQNLLKQYTHIDNLFFRFPGGCYSESDLKITQKLNVLPIQWDTEGPDSFNTNTQSIISHLLKGTHSGAIIVLHLHGGPNAPETANVLKEYIPKAKSLGYQFVKLSKLLQ